MSCELGQSKTHSYGLFHRHRGSRDSNGSYDSRRYSDSAKSATTAATTQSTLKLPDAESTTLEPPSPFHPTLQLHIEAMGRGDCLLTDMGSSVPESTSIYVVDSSAASALVSPALVSLRTAPKSSNCSLIAGPAYNLLTDHEEKPPAPHTLSTTMYRCGPGRAPRIDVAGDAGDTLTSSPGSGDSFAVQSTSIFTRSQRVRTRLGTFEWRYAGRSERKAVSEELLAGVGGRGNSGGIDGDKKAAKRLRKHHDVKCLLVLEQIVRVCGPSASSSSSSAPQEIRRPVARFIRNAALRTPGSSRRAAGNGGRLQLDLRAWAASDDSSISDREAVVVMAVSTALCLLKKEVDRRKGQEAAALAAMVS